MNLIQELITTNVEYIEHQRLTLVWKCSIPCV